MAFLKLLSIRVLSNVTARTSKASLAAIIPSRHTQARMMSSTSAPGAVGVARALQADTLSSTRPTPTLFTQEFSLADRVALVSGGHRGLGLEMAMALAEAGARAVYCVDLPERPDQDWMKVRDYVGRMGMGRLEYMSGNVCDQEQMWKIAEDIGNREGRMDVCVAAAGIAGASPILQYPAKQFQQVVDVNLNGVLFTAQAAGRQMVRFDNGGSIVLISSVCGLVALEPTYCDAAYHSTKAGVIQMGRSMACELGSKGIRVNTLCPGWFKTKLTKMLDEFPELEAQQAALNPLGRIGRTHELRGVIAWLASDASSFCTGSHIVVSGGHHAW